jgi:hypothetical protein
LFPSRKKSKLTAFIEKHKHISFDTSKLSQWKDNVIKNFGYDFQNSIYYPLLTQNGENFSKQSIFDFNMKSTSYYGKEYPRWVFKNDRYLPAWLVLDEHQERTIVDLDYCKKTQHYPIITQDKLTNIADGYFQEILSVLESNGMKCTNGWLAGFKPNLTYHTHIHGTKNNYQYILHIPITSGPEYEMIFHGSSVWKFNGFEPGSLYILDPREWHSAYFSGNYERYHICLHVYDMNKNFSFGNCNSDIYNRQLSMASTWLEQMNLEQTSNLFLEWNDCA